MQFENQFTEAFHALMARGGANAAHEGDETGVYRLVADGVPVTFAIKLENPEVVHCHAIIGSLKGLARRDLVLKQALEANFFWLGNAGSTVSLLADTGELMLGDRRDASYFADGQALADYLGAFVGTVRSWRMRLDGWRTAAADGAGEGEKKEIEGVRV